MPGSPLRVHPIVIVAKREHATSWYIDVETRERPAIGDIFYHPRALLDQRMRRALSPEFWRAYAIRERYPIVLVLPDHTWWVIDDRAFTNPGGYHGNGWTVTSVPPLATITVRPSIRTTEYHGILTSGVLVPCPDSRY